MQQVKPRIKLVGEDGNIFAIIGRCSQALKKAGLCEEAKEMATRVMQSGSYDAALATVLEYVEEGGDDENDEWEV